MDAKLFNGTTKYQKFLLSPKLNLFGLHKIACRPWQPIRHCSWVICKQTQDWHLRAAHTFIDFFLSLPLIQGKQAVSYWRNKMVAKKQRKNWLEHFTLPPYCENTQYDFKENGCTYKMIYIKAATHPRLPTLVPNWSPDIVFYSISRYANFRFCIFMSINIKIKKNS